jgi:hypothetical protein
LPTAFDIMADAIVNPRCNECSTRVEPTNPLLGPHLCYRCTAIMRAESERDFRDYQSQERRRKYHVVKLPPEMQ